MKWCLLEKRRVACYLSNDPEKEHKVMLILGDKTSVWSRSIKRAHITTDRNDKSTLLSAISVYSVLSSNSTNSVAYRHALRVSFRWTDDCRRRTRHNQSAEWTLSIEAVHANGTMDVSGWVIACCMHPLSTYTPHIAITPVGLEWSVIRWRQSTIWNSGFWISSRDIFKGF